MIRKKLSRVKAILLGRKEFTERHLFTKDFQKYRRYSIGHGTYGEPDILDFEDGSTLRIGNYCSLAGVTILLGGEHISSNPSTYPFESINLKMAEKSTIIVKDRFTKGDVTIGSDVWIGHKAMILSGVNIGHGAIIGASAVVTRDVPPYAVVVGNPSKIVKYRFSEETIQSLLTISWWAWDQEKIANFTNDFSLPVDEFIAKHKERDGK